MTVITAWWDKKGAAMAADGNYNYGSHGALQVGGASKVFVRGQTLIGMAGTSALLAFWRAVPGILTVDEIDKYIEDWRRWLDAHGHGQVVDGLRSYDVAVLMVRSDGIHRIDCYLHRDIAAEPYAAIGSGRDQAYGALWAMNNEGVERSNRGRRDVVITAVTAAHVHAVGIGVVDVVESLTW